LQHICNIIDGHLLFFFTLTNILFFHLFFYFKCDSSQLSLHSYRVNLSSLSLSSPVFLLFLLIFSSTSPSLLYSSSSLSILGYTEIGSFPYPIELKHNLVEKETKLIQFVKFIRCEKNAQKTELKIDIALPLNEERNKISSLKSEGVGNAFINREKESSDMLREEDLNLRKNNNTHTSLPPHWRSVQPVRPNTDESDDECDNEYYGRNSIDNRCTGQYSHHEDSTNMKHKSNESIDNNSDKIDEKVTDEIYNKIGSIDTDDNKNINDINTLSILKAVKSKQKGRPINNVRTRTFSLSDTIEESFDLLYMD
jgi:hypothetical protein